MTVAEVRERRRLRAAFEPSLLERFVWFVSKPRFGWSHTFAATVSVAAGALWLG